MRREAYLAEEFVEKMRSRYYHEKKMDDFFPRKLKNIAVLGVDLQNFFLNPKYRAYLPSSENLIKNLERFYTHSKNTGLKIIFTRHEHRRPENMAQWWHDEMLPDTEKTEIAEALVNFADYVVEKRTYDAFYHTKLDEILKNLEIEAVIITGVMTHLCCETTARSAFVRGYNVIFPIDGTATQNASLHECTLRAISHGFAPTPTLEDVMEWMQRWE